MALSLRRSAIASGVAVSIATSFVPPLCGLCAADDTTEIGYRAANQIEAYYDTNLDESVVDDRLDVEITYGRLSAGAVLLSHSASNPLLSDPNLYGADFHGVRKRWVEGTYLPITARVGDSDATFSNGLVLRIYEDQTVDFDNSVDGCRVRVDLDRLSLEGIAGTNSFGEPRSNVKGLAATYDVGGGWTAGVHGALVDLLDANGPLPGRDDLAGVATTGVLPADVTLTAEYAIHRVRLERPGEPDPADGHGAYAALTGSRGPLSLLLEAKDFLRFRHAYAIPPTAVRQHATPLLNRGSHVPNIRMDDERGFQAEAVATIHPDFRVTGNYSASEARHADLPAEEIYADLDAAWAGSHWILRADRAEETVREGDHRTLYERATFGGNWLRVFRSFSAEIAYETQGILEQNLARASFEPAREYRDHVASITVGMAPTHSWSATLEWTDNERAVKDSWLWIEWGVRLGVLGNLTLGGGSVRGGTVCSGGVCKVVAPFDGGRVELLTNF